MCFPLSHFTACPANISVSADPGVCNTFVSFGPLMAMDNCGVASTAHLSGGSNNSLFMTGTDTVSYGVWDAHGNTVQCSFGVTVVDTQPPQISCPAAITVMNTHGACVGSAPYTAPVGTDNCPGATTHQSAGTVGYVFAVGTSLVSYSVTDAASHTASCDFNVTVVDNEPPVIREFRARFCAV